MTLAARWLVCLVLLWPAVGSAQSPTSLEALTQRYLDGLFRAKPHLATFMGDHRFDDRLPDLSEQAISARRKELLAERDDIAEFSARVRSAHNIDSQIDEAILADAIALELLYLDEIRDWEWNARLEDSFPVYDPRELIGDRLSTLVHGDFAPEAVRAASLVAELKALPVFLAQKERALGTGKRHPTRVSVDQAIKDNRGRIEFFQTEVKAFTERTGAEAARTTALAALERHQSFLEKELSPRADGDWRLGAALYRKKFPLALQTTMTPEQMVPRAEAAFGAARRELYAVARTLHRTLWPSVPVPTASADGKTQAMIIGKVKDELSKDHPAAGDLVAAHARTLDRIRAFIATRDLVELPPKETLLVEPMPIFKRGAVGAEYLAPGVLEHRDKWHATYYVDPVDPSWPAQKIDSYLRGQNQYEVELTAMHEAYPGHHTQYFYSKRNLNALRAVLWNAPMAEGWAVYGEGLVVRLGFGDEKNDRYRFFDLRGQMISASNLLLDVKLHSGQMTDAEAVRFMVEEGFQERATAEKKLLRAKLDSTQLAQYFLGHDEITRLEADARKKGTFSQRAFDEAVIGHGSIAVKFLRRLLLGE